MNFSCQADVFQLPHHRQYLFGQRYWKDQGTFNMSDERFQIHLKEMHKNEAII